MATKTFKIGLSDTDKQNMAQDVYERLIDMCFDEYDSANTYNKGDFVVYEDVLYKCKQDNVTGAWDSSKWETATFQDLVDDVEGAVASVNSKANVDGNYPTMTVGNADQLNSTVFVLDKVPYLYRTSGGDADIGNREYDKIIGGSLVVNQLFDSLSTTSGSQIRQWFSYFIGDQTITHSLGETTTASTASELEVGQRVNQSANSVLLWSVKAKVNNGTPKLKLKYSTTGGTLNQYQKGNLGTSYIEFSGLTKNPSIVGWIGVGTENTAERDRTLTVKDFMCINLTQMFGSTIADYIYTLETNNAGSGVAWFRNYFKELYYPYNTGAIKSVKLTSHDMVGFNQWDEEWELGSYANETGLPTTANDRIRSKNDNPIRVLPNTTYYFKSPNNGKILCYDANGVFIPTSQYSWQYAPNINANSTFTTPINCCFVRFNLVSGYGTTYNNDICINLSWSGWRNGQYEPYQKNSYPLDTDIELRGIAKLDGDNNLYYDGDEYSSDGKVVRKYGIVDLGTVAYTNGGYGFIGTITDIVKATSNAQIGTFICPLYTSASYNSIFNNTVDMAISLRDSGSSNKGIVIRDTSKSSLTAEQFKSAMSGVYLVYELETPTEETADTFQDPQIVNDFGTEEYVVPTQNGWQVPVGHDTKYPANLRDKLQRLPDMPSVSQNVTETYVVNYNGTTKKCAFVAIETWLSGNGYVKDGDNGILKNAIGGTLRQLLANSQSIDFLNTAWVDLGTLEWAYNSNGATSFRASIGDNMKNTEQTDTAKILCTKYGNIGTGQQVYAGTKTLAVVGKTLWVYDLSAGTDATAFKAAMKGVLLAYEKA